MKICTKCKILYPTTTKFFYRNSRTKDGLGWRCKECIRKYNQSEEGKLLSRLRVKKFRYSEKGKLYYKKYSQSEKRKLSIQKYDQSGKGKVAKQRYKQKNRLGNSISDSIRVSLRSNKNGRHWEDLVGYTIIELQLHLQGTIGLTTDYVLDELWKGFYGPFYWLEHIQPKASFKNLEDSTSKDFQECWALDNLKLLDPIENMRKNNKWEGE